VTESVPLHFEFRKQTFSWPANELALVVALHEIGGAWSVVARLIAVATYERCVPALRAELDRVGNDLPAFYAAMSALIHDATARAGICPPS